MEQPNYLDGFIQQFKEELSDEDWTVSRWLQWMKLNGFEITKKKMNKETVTISKKKLQKLLDNFYNVCSMCDELDIYELQDLDKSMQKKKEWVEEHFSREINKESYE